MGHAFTKHQQDAIDVRQGTVLVSAAAGSGKTSVLTQRVVDILCDESHPVSPDKILVVTFTNAAAAEMKQRIFMGIGDKIKQCGTSHYLRGQQAMLNFAAISTVHAFCMSLVREHASLLGINRDFSIGDTAQMAVLRDKSMDQTLNECYGEADPVFLSLTQLFGSDKNDRDLERVILNLYYFFMSIPSKEQWIQKQLSYFEADCDFADTPWGKELLFEFGQYISWAIQLYQSMIDQVCYTDDYEKIVAMLQQDLQGLQNLLQASSCGCYQTFYDCLQNFSFGRFPVVRALSGDAQKEKIKDNRDTVKLKIANFSKSVFVRDQKSHGQDVQALKPLIECLYRVVGRFCDNFYDLKLQENLLDFNDLEQNALKLLSVSDGDTLRPSHLAQKLQREYAYILVDEYQDTNAVQDSLFFALSNGQDNLFMVGDVKQSIYKFRQANPDLFLQKSKEFAPYDGQVFPSLITLEQNFRSSKNVIDFVNFLFGKIMSPQNGDVTYDNSHALTYSGGYTDLPPQQTATQILLVDSQNFENELQADAQAVADAIKQYIDSGFLVWDKGVNRKATYSDFAVLLRSASAAAPVYLSALHRLSIPAEGERGEAFLGKKEISMVLSYLKVIDNPTDDVALAATLLSPLFGFSPDRLAQIKNRGKGRLFSMLQTCEQQDVTQFLQLTAHLQKLSVALSAKELIDRIYSATDLKNKVLSMSEGRVRYDNLDRLLLYASKFVAAGTLRSFIDYTTAVREAGEDFAPACNLQKSDCVRVMTIHKSKGLEYPVVFVAGLHKNFNRQDSTGKTLLSPALGFSCYRRKEDRTQHTTLVHEAVRKNISRSAKSEELRVLYVAATRAKQKLVMSMSFKNIGAELQNAQVAGCSPTAIGQCENFKAMILRALCKLSSFENTLHDYALLPTWDTKATFDTQIQLVVPKAPLHQEEQLQSTDPVVCEPHPQLTNQLRARIYTQYPYEQSANVPAKVTASSLTKRGDILFVSRPAFATSGGLTPTERGNALHKFMQYCDFSLAISNAKAEIDRMLALQYLSQPEANSIYPDAIDTFFQGQMGQLLQHAKKIYRELKFFTFGSVDDSGQLVMKDLPNRDKVLIQGIADCVLDMGDHLIIIDYKTDRVTNMQTLALHYGPQLAVYAKGVGDLLAKKVDQCLLYSFYLGQSTAL